MDFWLKSYVSFDCYGVSFPTDIGQFEDLCNTVKIGPFNVYFARDPETFQLLFNFKVKTSLPDMTASLYTNIFEPTLEFRQWYVVLGSLDEAVILFGEKGDCLQALVEVFKNSYLRLEKYAATLNVAKEMGYNVLKFAHIRSASGVYVCSTLKELLKD